METTSRRLASTTLVTASCLSRSRRFSSAKSSTNLAPRMPKSFSYSAILPHTFSSFMFRLRDGRWRRRPERISQRLLYGRYSLSSASAHSASNCFWVKHSTSRHSASAARPRARLSILRNSGIFARYASRPPSYLSDTTWSKRTTRPSSLSKTLA